MTVEAPGIAIRRRQDTPPLLMLRTILEIIPGNISGSGRADRISHILGPARIVRARVSGARAADPEDTGFAGRGFVEVQVDEGCSLAAVDRRLVLDRRNPLQRLFQPRALGGASNGSHFDSSHRCQQLSWRIVMYYVHKYMCTSNNYI